MRARLRSPRLWLVPLVVAAALGGFVADCVHFDWKLDDAYIAFAYAQNWVAGHGIVFNPGERVEGYTCFLWVAASALGLLLGADVRWWSTTLGVLAGGGTLLAAWRLAVDVAPVRLRGIAVVALVVLAGYPALAWWAASGMETTLFTLLVTVAIWRHVRDGAGSVVAPVCLALASMTRPEGWLLAGVLCLDAFRIGTVRQATRYAGLFAALFGPYYAWRFWYYGYPFPSTFYAKVGYTRSQLYRGAAYLRDFLGPGAGAPVLAVAALGARRRTLGVHAFLLAYLAYVVSVGGDVFAFHRFLVPIVPAAAAFAAAGLLRVAARLPRPLPVALLLCAGSGLALVPLFLPAWRAQSRELPAVHRMERFGDLACERLRAATGPDEEIATVAVGQIRYCTGRRVIDMVGLTDRQVAHRPATEIGSGLAGHEKFDSEYVLARWPRYILIPDEHFPHPVGAVHDMWRQPLFRTYYVRDWYAYRRIDAPPAP